MEIKRITVGEVRERMDRGEPLVFVDARSADAWSTADTQIPGSIRVPPGEVEPHLAAIPKGRPIVTYCT